MCEFMSPSRAIKHDHFSEGTPYNEVVLTIGVVGIFLGEYVGLENIRSWDDLKDVLPVDRGQDGAV